MSPRYDFTTSSRCDPFVSTPPGQLIIVEGIFLLAADVLRQQLDYTVLVSTCTPIRRHRRVERDIRQRGFTEAGAIRLEQQATAAFDRLNPNPDQLADLVVDGSAPLESIVDNLLTVIVSKFSPSLS
jgi:uridine kinase